MMTEADLPGGVQRGYVSVIRILPHQMGLCVCVCVKGFSFSGSALGFHVCVTQRRARPRTGHSLSTSQGCNRI